MREIPSRGDPDRPSNGCIQILSCASERVAPAYRDCQPAWLDWGIVRPNGKQQPSPAPRVTLSDPTVRIQYGWAKDVRPVPISLYTSAPRGETGRLQNAGSGGQCQLSEGETCKKLATEKWDRAPPIGATPNLCSRVNPLGMVFAPVFYSKSLLSVCGRPARVFPAAVNCRPCRVLARRPIWSRYGSTTSSSVPASSPSVAAIASRPAGPPS